VTAEIMRQQVKTQYVQGDGFDAVELPYVSPRFSETEYPRELSMLLIIPHAGRFDSVEKEVTKIFIDDAVSSLGMGTVTLSLPKFEFEYEVGCRAVLQGLGMVDPFEPLTADFSGMVDPALSRPWIDEIYHKAFVAVDEKGTEAAAATAVVMTETSIPEPVVISADRPFIFLIRDQLTNMILFMGRVMDPVSQ
jgi:serpin B